MIPQRSLFLHEVCRACLAPSSHTRSSSALWSGWAWLASWRSQPGAGRCQMVKEYNQLVEGWEMNLTVCVASDSELSALVSLPPL